MDDDFHGTGPQCSEPNTTGTGGDISSSRAWMVFFITMAFCLIVFLWRTYRMAKDAFDSYEQNYTDLAVVERSMEDLRRENSELRARVEAMEQCFNQVQAAYNELNRQQEMLSDSHEELHYGLVMLGGFTHHSNSAAAHVYN